MQIGTRPLDVDEAFVRARRRLAPGQRNGRSAGSVPAVRVTLLWLTVTRALESLVSCRTVMESVAAGAAHVGEGQGAIDGQRE